MHDRWEAASLAWTWSAGLAADERAQGLRLTRWQRFVLWLVRRDLALLRFVQARFEARALRHFGDVLAKRLDDEETPTPRVITSMEPPSQESQDCARDHDAME